MPYHKLMDGLVEWKNLTVENGYGHESVKTEEMFQWLQKYGTFFAPFICDTTEYLGNAIAERKSILFEAQPGALRDIDFGIYPYTSASTTLASYPPIGAGVPFAKLDVLSYMEKIPVCTAYEIDGRRVEHFPSGIEELNAAKPVYEYLTGFQCDISGCRTAEDLPKEALDYIRYIEKMIACPIKYVSVGAERDAYITM